MGLRLLLIFLLTLILAPSLARAQCVNPAGNEAEIIYNTTHNVPQYCDGSNWIAMVGQAPEPTGPQNCSSIGDTCDDGSIYAGLSPDGNVAMYTTPADAASTYTWNDGTTNYTDMSMANCTDASPGTAATCQAGEANTAFLVGATGEPDYPFAAAEYCDGLSAHGYSDWYLPAQDELNVLYTNKNTGNLNGTFDETGAPPAGIYWTSSELDVNDARIQRFSDGLQSTGTKSTTGFSFRCVRRHQVGEGISQQTEVVPSGLVGHWRLDETAGATVVADSSGNGNDGFYDTMAGSSFELEGIIGTAVTVENNEHVRITNNANINNLDQFSISVWAKDVNAGAGHLFNKPGEFSIYSTPSQDWLRFSATRWDTGGSWRTDDNVVKEGKWNHIVLTYDQSSTANDPVLYINNEVIPWNSIDTNPIGTLNVSAASDLYIGNSDGNNEWDNAIDDFRLYNRVLTATEVAELYEAKDGIRYNANYNVPEFFDGNKFVQMTPAWPEVTDGLIGHWKLDETSGTTAGDSSDNGNDGTMQNGLSAVSDSSPGAVGKALSFNAPEEQVVTIPYSSGLEIPQNRDLTVSAWIIMPIGNADQTIFRNGSGINPNYFILEVSSSNFANFAVYDDASAHEDIQSTTTLNDGSWHHLIGIRDGATGQIYLYVDGVSEGVPSGIVTDALSSGGDYRIGARSANGASEPFLGAIDDVRIYDRALTAAEIQTLYAMGAPVGQNTALPQGCSNAGDPCDDGTFFLGFSPDGSEEMYMTSIEHEGVGTWNNGTANWFQTGLIDLDTGEANTQALASATDIGAPYIAARYCSALDAHGASDWYLPAGNEGLMFRSGSNFWGDIRTGNDKYWLSTELNNAQADNRAYKLRMDTGVLVQTGDNKADSTHVRCVRKGPAPRCANPYGLEGNMVYNTTHDVVQYCDGARWVAVGKRGP